MNIVQDFHKLSEFRKNLPEIADNIERTRRPAFITKNGDVCLAVIYADDYQKMLDAEEIENIAKIRKAIAGVRNGQVISHDKFWSKWDAEHKPVA